jgi:hypothetical protein
VIAGIGRVQRVKGRRIHEPRQGTLPGAQGAELGRRPRVGGVTKLIEKGDGGCLAQPRPGVRRGTDGVYAQQRIDT